jgi:hypothetical protein
MPEIHSSVPKTKTLAGDARVYHKDIVYQPMW